MGLGMATNLQKYIVTKSLSPLSYTNRTLSRGDSLKAIGGIPCSSIADVVQGSDIIFSSISDDSVLLSLVESFVASGNVAGKILADTSTVHPETSAAVSVILSNVGAIFLATPVFGASPAAAAGTVLFAAAGASDHVSTVLPFLSAMGRKVLRVGAEPAKALLLKTTSNFLMSGLMELVAEAHVFAEKTGLGSDALEELLQENFGAVIYSDSLRMTTGVYAPPKGKQPWSAVGLAIKDVGHGVTMAEQGAFKLPVGELALKHLTEAKAWGDKEGRSLDSTSIYGIVRQEAGLDFETDVVKNKSKDAEGN
jgi:3-hydroxyisobutyrate dehydrogenase-like beta-hydroxyacid dehydrogenase